MMMNSRNAHVQGPDLAALAGLQADSTRAGFRVAVLDGRAWTAIELARHIDVAASTAIDSCPGRSRAVRAVEKHHSAGRAHVQRRPLALQAASQVCPVVGFVPPDVGFVVWPLRDVVCLGKAPSVCPAQEVTHRVVSGVFGRPVVDVGLGEVGQGQALVVRPFQPKGRTC
jgi:hypothetical protein